MKKARLWSAVGALVLVCAALAVREAFIKTSTQSEAPGQLSGDRFCGRAASGFTLTGIDGRYVDVGRFIGKKPIVLAFYRGVW